MPEDKWSSAATPSGHRRYLILIDEARTLSSFGSRRRRPDRRRIDLRIARSLTRDEDHEVDEKKKTVGILEPGIDKVE